MWVMYFVCEHSEGCARAHYICSTFIVVGGRDVVMLVLFTVIKFSVSDFDKSYLINNSQQVC